MRQGLGLLDHDIAQVEGLARLDGEFLAELGLGRIARRVVVDAVRGARDQRREGELPLGIGDQALPVMDRVEPGDGVLIGRQAVLVGLDPGSTGAARGDDHHGHVRPVGVARAGDRLAGGVDQPRPGRAAGLEPDGDRSVRRRPAREQRGRPQVVLGIEEVDGDLGVSGQAVHREVPVPHRAVVIRPSRTARRSRSAGG